MRYSSPVRIGFTGVALAVLASCGPSTQLTSSWTDPTAPDRTYQKIAVVGVSAQSSMRHMYEDAFVAALAKRGTTAVASYTFTGDGKLDKDAASAKLQEMGVDAVIVTRLVDKETVQEYYPPTYTTMSAPGAYYGGWYGYYSLGYSYESSPGYVSTNKVYKLETNLYDLRHEKLMWSGLTETTIIQGDAPQQEIQPVIYTVLADMEKKKALPASKK